MYKITDKVIKFTEKTMENRKVKLTAGRKSLDEVKIQRRVFQVDVLSLLLFMILIIPLNYKLWKCTASYKLSKSQEKINTWTTSNCLLKRKKN